MRWYLIAYDVSKSGVRDKCARLLQKRGRRVQKSVFMLKCGAAAMRKLEQELHNILEQSDSLFILPVCERCLQSSIYMGELPPLLIFS